jgi:hypothetical protein
MPPDYSDEQRRAARKALYLYAAEYAAENPNWVGEMVNSDQAIERFGVTGQQSNAWRRNKKIVYFDVSRKKNVGFRQNSFAAKEKSYLA